MKGVLLSICPDAALVDVSHAIPPFDIRGGAFVLWAGTRSFPPGTVHLAVVDPGVGSERRALVVRADDRLWVAPDNGLLDRVLEQAPEHWAWELERPADASPTFEGRDVFAPAAARLAAGADPAGLGRPAVLPARLPDPGDVVLWVDSFGNLVTSVDPDRLRDSTLRVGGTEVRSHALTYSDAEAGEPFWYAGSLGLVEVGVPRARASDLLGVLPGDPVEVVGAA